MPDKKTRVFVTRKLYDDEDAPTVEFLKSGTASYSKRINNQTESIAWFGVYTLADLDYFKGLKKTKDLGELIENIKLTAQSGSPEIIVYSDATHKSGYGVRKVVEVREE